MLSNESLAVRIDTRALSPMAHRIENIAVPRKRKNV
jgi:hypothetical protein